MLQQPHATNAHGTATGGAASSTVAAPSHQLAARGATSGAGGVMLTPRGTVVKRPKARFGEPLKLLPVIFVACTILTLYCVYVFCHCIPNLQLSEHPEFVNLQMRDYAIYELVAFHLITPMLLICYVRSVMLHPGEIPDDDPHWEYKARDMRVGTDSAPTGLQETKKSGERRHCKWCGKFKPDRCHHCRVCKTCILKMDHHCPWIYNCVGFKNYKCFFLLLFYSVLDCHLIFWTMQNTVMKAVLYQPNFFRLFLLFFGQALTFFIGALVTLFFCFHIWLMLKAMTTIEFCEKSLPKKEGAETKNYDSSLYDLGFYGNIRAVLGENPLLWFIPFANALPAGDGLNFMSDETRLTVDMEIGKGMRRRGHRASQRPPRLLLGGEIYDDYAAYGLYPAGAYDESMLYGDQGYAGVGATAYGSTAAQLQQGVVQQYYDPAEFRTGASFHSA